MPASREPSGSAGRRGRATVGRTRTRTFGRLGPIGLHIGGQQPGHLIEERRDADRYSSSIIQSEAHSLAPDLHFTSVEPV